ncbi:hypothetical protein ACSQ6I_06170 [Anabaena sp. WFMT]|uniref:hypothetical protein n=1 Tax=Anabaena sp. WFMT TaxID=3449730 RepID=UPI003F27A671
MVNIPSLQMQMVGLRFYPQIQQSCDDEDAKDSLLMRLFLDFATTEALKNNTLQAHTTEMSEATHKLIN